MEELFASGRQKALELQERFRYLIARGDFVPSYAVSELRLGIPFQVRGFVDFYSSREHAENVGRRFRDPLKPLPENWLHLPAAYNGRASNVFPEWELIRRPRGQYKLDDGTVVFGPTRELDFEVEIGYFLCPAAPDGLAGFVLLNDWSARDIQRWEYVPLGPFLGKAFATTVSPYLVLPEALEPFRVPGPKQEPPPLEHLRQAEPRNWDIELQVRRVDAAGHEQVLSETNFRYMYWSVGQQVAHLRAGCVRLGLGDLHGSGTISSPSVNGEGSLLERGGPFLNDGDTLYFSGVASSPERCVGFGEMEMKIAAPANG
jgi:fumarylacetoacetase